VPQGFGHIGQKSAMRRHVVHTGCGSNLHEGVDNPAQPNGTKAFASVIKK
jgi:hypothetical protein